MSTPDVTAAPEAPSPSPAGLSFQDKVRAARAAAQNRKTKDFEIPGFDGTVWGTFKALDKWADVKGIVAKYAHLDEDEAEVMVAADSLLKSCVSLYGLDGGQRAPLNMNLGVQFAEWVEEGSTVAGMTDLQAVFVAIPNEVQLVMLYVALDQWYSGVGASTDAEQVKLRRTELVQLGAQISVLGIPIDLMSLWECEDRAWINYADAVVLETARMMKEAQDG